MTPTITLKVICGKLKGKEFVFDSRDICVLGRSYECRPKLPDDDAHQGISRYHCLLDISPPTITIRDFGSLNGTFLNGKKIGQRDQETPVSDAEELTSLEHNLQDGDEIEVGESLLKVFIKHPPPGANDPTQGNPPPPTNPGKSPTEPPIELAADSSVPTEKQLIDKAALAKTTPPQNKQTITTLNLVRSLLKKDKEINIPDIPGYDFREKIGEGVSGEVYLVEHTGTGDIFACKLMHPQAALQPQNRLEFQREIDIISKLKHPNIVKFVDRGYQNGLFYFIMEYCNAGTVQQLIEKNGGQLTVRDAVGITVEVLKGLEYAHNVELNAPVAITRSHYYNDQVQGVIHRDIKPTNIFLNSDTDDFTVIKIGDFGLAKAFDMAGLSGCTMTGAIAGSLCFVPRWQIVNYKYTGPETDIWATAACCYYMITGEIPRDFAAGTDPVKVILEQKPIPIRERFPDVGEKLAEIIDRALQDSASPVYPNATEFTNALLSY